MSEREVLKTASEHLRDLHQGLDNIGSVTSCAHYTENTYIPVTLRNMAKPTQDRYAGVIRNYLQLAFGKLALRDLTPMTIDRYLAGLSDSELSQESLDKVRDVLASILKRAIRHGLLVKNLTEGLELQRDNHGRITKQPVISYEQYEQLLASIPELDATMIYVAIWVHGDSWGAVDNRRVQPPNLWRSNALAAAPTPTPSFFATARQRKVTHVSDTGRCPQCNSDVGN
jgi:hypothetical protein